MSDDFDRELALLRAEYAEALGAKVAELVACLGPERDGAALDRARQLAHRLAGTAGSYGLPHVGAAALALERALIRQQECGGDDAPVHEAATALVRAAGIRA